MDGREKKRFRRAWAKVIKKLRTATPSPAGDSKKLSQTELGRMMRPPLSQQHVSAWERALATPTMDEMVDLARIFGLSVGELFDRVTTVLEGRA